MNLGLNEFMLFFTSKNIDFINLLSHITKFFFLNLGEESDVRICQVYLVFKQQGHNSLSKINHCNLSIRQALETDFKNIFQIRTVQSQQRWNLKNLSHGLNLPKPGLN